MARTRARIENVIDRLDTIVAESRASDDRRGYFASLYKRVTVRVHELIRAGRFENPDRVDVLDDAFAQRYFDAYDAYRSGGTPTRSWRIAFDAATSRRPIILQHLFLGMNAHINLDLGVAAAAISTPADLIALQRDFFEVNRVLAEMVDGVQARLASVSPWIGLVDRFGGRADEALARKAIDVARGEAWKAAENLIRSADEDDRFERMRALDDTVAGVASRIYRPDLVTRVALMLVRRRESRRPRAIIDALESPAFWGDGA